MATVALMDGPWRDLFLAVGTGRQQAVEAIAAKIDEGLERLGDTNRERFLYGIVEEPDNAMVEFGTNLAGFAAVLEDYYGMWVERVKPGTAVSR